MIGRKKLSEIRQELKRAIAHEDKDPIHWLEERIKAFERQGPAGSGGSEVLAALERLLKGPRKRRTRKQRVSAKK